MYGVSGALWDSSKLAWIMLMVQASGGRTKITAAGVLPLAKFIQVWLCANSFPAMKHLLPFHLAFVVLLTSAASIVRAEVLVSAPGRVDCIPDGSGGLLYISTGTNHSVLRYSLATGVFLAPFQVGGEPGALDLSPDGTLLAMADAAQDGTNEVIHLIDLATGVDTPVRLPRGPAGDPGLQSIAFGADGSLVVASRGITQLQLRRIEPVTHAMSVLAEVPGSVQLAASGDRQQIGIAIHGDVRLYNVATKTLGATQFHGGVGIDIALNSNGSQYALVGGSSSVMIADNTGASGQFFHTIGTSAVGTVFHPNRPLAFVAYGRALEVVIVNTETRKLVGTIVPAGPAITVQSFPQWPLRLRISSDGSQLFLPIPDGVRIIPIGTEALSLRGAKTFGLDGEIAVAFTAPVAPSTATNTTRYILEPNGTTTSARIDPNNSSVVLLQSTGTPQRVRVTGVEGLLGDSLPLDSVVEIQPDAGTATDGSVLGSVSIQATGFQFEFSSTPGMTYRVEESQDLISWRPTGEVTASSHRTRATIPLQPEAGRRFVRVLRF